MGMSSSLGMLVADKFHPIFDNWNEGEFVSSMQSHFSETAVKNFWPAFWIMTAGHELATTFADYDGKEEFDYGFDPLNLRPEDAEKATEYETMELNHGRWAMFCAAGIMAQELVTGQTVIQSRRFERTIFDSFLPFLRDYVIFLRSYGVFLIACPACLRWGSVSCKVHL